jgi:hypothetical protein
MAARVVRARLDEASELSLGRRPGADRDGGELRGERAVSLRAGLVWLAATVLGGALGVLAGHAIAASVL